MRFFKSMLLLTAILLVSCSGNQNLYDASGTFEADEVIVSARQNGQLISFNAEEGDTISSGTLVGTIDVGNIQLQKEQVQATIQSLQDKTANVQPQVDLIKKQLAVQEAQLAQQLREKTRTENLVKADAATQKQLDDINAAIDQLQKQIAATRQQIQVAENNVATQNRNVFSEKTPLEKSVAQIQDQIDKGQIINPVSGTVLTKYAMQGEVTSIGKALYKIANLDTLTLKAYVTGNQLSQIKLGQQVTVLVDSTAKTYRHYAGTVYWVSDESEFTPKTIQTKDERANLVYAVKIRVKNDGHIKIGMYGEVKFAQQ
ncbi:MAG TPA: HlyD family efflux transporter periplasmic adaptor subunit [Chitinophagaceae bacterium]|nr:HlyD family efflux transporter periplasmic adaptor subunit [Chitinophagaceae bacterium]